jgi:hypothetical protein
MVNQHDLLFSPFLVGFFHPFSVAVHQEGAIMLINLFTWRAENPARADKSAVGAINRPLRCPDYFVNLHHWARRAAPTCVHRFSPPKVIDP